MNRDSKSSAIIALTVFASLIAASQPAVCEERPNILVLIADDAGMDFGCYGNSGIQTPHIDSLAATGLRVENAFLTASHCSPSRTSMISGQFAHTIGTENLNDQIDASIATVPEYLREQGYFTGLVLKDHMDWKNRAQRFHWYDEGWPFYKTHAIEWEQTAVSRFEKFLDLADERPFFMWFGFVDPHREYGDHPIPKVNDPAAVTVPPYLVDDQATRRDLADYYDEITRLDGHVGGIVELLKSRGQLENTLIVFLSDNGMPFPRAKATVYDAGIQTPLVLSWPGKIRPGSVLREQLVSVIDLAPTLLDVAGIRKPDQMYGESLLPLLLGHNQNGREYVFAERHWHGTDEHLVAIRSRTHKLIYTVEHAQWPLGTGSDVYTSPSWYALKDRQRRGALTPAQARLFEMPRAQLELYDLQQDPHELVNLADRPESLPRVREMLAELQQWRRATGDPAPHQAGRRKSDVIDRITGVPLQEPPITH